MTEIALQIFRAGTHDGVDYSVSVLDQLVQTFAPERFAPPLIFTHVQPEGVSDADLAATKLCYGVPTRLERVGDLLFAFFDPAKISQQFIEWVRAGYLIAKSVSLYPPWAKNNPAPGLWCLRHVAALGSEPPRVKNLPPLLSEIGMEGEYLEFAEGVAIGDFAPVSLPPEQVVVDLRRAGMLEAFVALLRAYLGERRKKIEDVAAALGITPAELESRLSGEIDFAEGQLAQLVTAATVDPSPSARELALEARLAELEQQQRQAQIAGLRNFAEGLAEQGRLLPGEVEAQIKVLESLWEAAQTADFAEGESPLDRHQQFLGGLKPRIDYQERTAGAGDDLAESEPEDFAEDPGSERLYKAAKKYQAANPGTAWDVAVRAVTKGAKK